MYQVVFTRGYSHPWEQDFTPVGPVHLSLAAAIQDRKLSGDLVIDPVTLRVVQDPAWLFPWERTRPDCFAQQMMRSDARTGDLPHTR